MMFAKGYNLVQGMEATNKNSKFLQESERIVQRITQPPQKCKDKGEKRPAIDVVNEITQLKNVSFQMPNEQQWQESALSKNT